jgi:DNA polymerase III subunit epsilon
VNVKWPWLRSQSIAAHSILQKNEAFFAALDPNRPISDYEFVVFDTELTGLNPRRDEIVSIGAVRVKNLEIIADDCFYSSCRTARQEHTIGTFIHRITPDEVRIAPEPRVVVPAFVEFCAGAAIVGHFVSIDISFLDRACRRIMGGIMKNPCLDSIKLAKAHDKRIRKKSRGKYKITESYNLRRLAKAYNLPIFQQHNAQDDAVQTAYLFIFLVKILAQDGLETFGDFYRIGRHRRWWF